MTAIRMRPALAATAAIPALHSRIWHRMTNDMPERPSPRPAALRRMPLAIAAVLIGVAVGSAVVYGVGGLKRHAAGDSACRPAVDLAQKLAPLAQGEVAALTMATAPLRLPDLAFEDAEGKPSKLSGWRAATLRVNPPRP